MSTGSSRKLIEVALPLEVAADVRKDQGDRSPLLVIADDPPEVSGPEVIGAARALLRG